VALVVTAIIYHTDKGDIVDYAQLGTVGILFGLAIKEFFGWLKSRKDDGDNYGKAILDELRKQNNNHLTHVQGSIEQGNKDNKEAIRAGFQDLKQSAHNDTILIVEALGEIKGTLRR